MRSPAPRPVARTQREIPLRARHEASYLLQQRAVRLASYALWVAASTEAIYLRVDPALKRALEASARENRVTLTQEIVNRCSGVTTARLSAPPSVSPAVVRQPARPTTNELVREFTLPDAEDPFVEITGDLSGFSGPDPR